MDTGSIKQMEDIVGNRVATIQEETASATWRHVPSQSNPANLISRGVEPKTLSKSTLWWKGPQWLICSTFYTSILYNVYGEVELFLHAFDGELNTVITSLLGKEAP
jgi:hypothetical protein